jgi:putative pyruvate formate lyase activating enzyme
MREPSYLELYRQGKLAARAGEAWELLRDCRLCPRDCGVDRTRSAKGYCRTGEKAQVASAHPHFGEEAPLVGRYGSGTIFFSHCNLRCRFCQNYDISQEGEGREIAPETLASLMLTLQGQGCHNINFVTPSHVIPQILAALVLAAKGGLRLPLVYNSGGYDSVAALKMLDGIFDIYMPDFKFWNPEWAAEYAGAPDYRKQACEAILEMHRQVGDLEIAEGGIAHRGLLVRHLVLPDKRAGTEEIMTFLASQVSPATYVNIMGQYHPAGAIHGDPHLGRRPTRAEIQAARAAAVQAGLLRLD